MRGNARDQLLGALAPAFGGPHAADLVQVAADAAGRDDDGGAAELEVLDDVPRTRLTTRLAGGGEDAAAHADDAGAASVVVFDDELVHAVAEMEFYLALFFCFKEWFAENAHDLWARAPGEVEARHGVAVAGGIAGTTLGPADGGQDVEA